MNPQVMQMYPRVLQIQQQQHLQQNPGIHPGMQPAGVQQMDGAPQSAGHKRRKGRQSKTATTKLAVSLRGILK